VGISFGPSAMAAPSGLVRRRKPLLITLAPFLPTLCGGRARRRLQDQQMAGGHHWASGATWKVKNKWLRG